MRSPLAAIRSTADATLSGPARTPQACERRSRCVQRESERLTRISSDLLLLARSDDGQLEPRMEQFDLSVLVADAVEEHHNAGAGQTAVRQLQPDLPVRADPDEVKRVILNLWTTRTGMEATACRSRSGRARRSGKRSSR